MAPAREVVVAKITQERHVSPCGTRGETPAANDVVARPNVDVASTEASLIGNDQILYRNIQSTFYLVTPMKDATRRLRDGEPFVICSSGATIGWCDNQNTLGAWNLGTALPMSQPPPQPGFVLIYSNPLNSQTLTEPPGSKMNFVGEMNFCSATLDCVTGGGGGLFAN